MFSTTTIIIAVISYFRITDALSSHKRALSPTAQIPSPEYVKLLNHSILFYEAQRSGKLPSDNRVSWRYDSALQDGLSVSNDLTGGYYDAGNYLKFTFPLSYTVFMLSWGGADYIEGYQLANQTNYLRDQIKWATDWLIKAHPHPATLFVQVGDLDVDNNYFGPDSNIPTPRPCFQINETNFGTDAASMAATAFASASYFFNQLAQSKTGNQEDSKYAETLLMHATQLYNSSHSIFPYSRYQTSVHAVENAYASTDYMDDLILSGVAMYKATRDKSYLDQSLKLYKSTAGISGHSEPLGWDNKWGALYVLFAELMLDSPDHSEALERRIDAENYLDNIVSGITVNKTNGGLLFWDFFRYTINILGREHRAPIKHLLNIRRNNSNSNSNQNAMSVSHLLLSYSTKVLRPLSEKSSDKDTVLAKIKRYEDLANSQLDYILGKNPLNQNYVVGELPNSPKYPHSASASGFKSLDDAIKNPSDLSQAHTIYGAMVGGPSKNDSFSDVLLDWTQTEVALDYNAPYQNVLAYQVMFNPKSPFYVSDKVDSNNQDENLKIVSNPVPSWGIALAVVLPISTLMGIFAFLIIRYRKRKDTEKEQSITGNNIDEESTIRQLGIDEFQSSGSTLVFNEAQQKKGAGLTKA